MSIGDAGLFDLVLSELRALTLEFQRIGVGTVLVGAQVLSVEAREAGGDGLIEVTTPTGLVLVRGYSLEPDLLIDVDSAGARAEAVTDCLAACGFKRVKTSRWRKALDRGEVQVDLFVPPDSDDVNNPAGLMRLPAGDLAMARPRVVRISLATGVLEIAVPDPIGFIAMKLEAKLRLRPTQTKDSFDIYAYAATKGAPAIAAALANSTADGPRISRQLAQLFGEVDAPGVADVVSYAEPLGDEERALLARAVVDLFDAIREA